MSRRTTIGWLALSVLTVAWGGCRPDSPIDRPAAAGPAPVESDPAPRDPKQVALEARDALFQQLSSRLLSAMSNGGPVAAIEVCSREAPRIAAAVGQEHGVAIGRTSWKLRNSKNAAPPWAEELVSRQVESEQFVTLPEGDLAALLPIRLKAQCLVCHGPENEIAEDLRIKLRELYPDDQATGFQEGQLRGWFWVVVPTAAPAADPSTSSRAPGVDPAHVFAEFDRLYIPALALTKQEKPGPAQVALQRFAEHFRRQQRALADSLPADVHWSADLKGIELAIAAAQQRQRDGELQAAHEALETIRDVLLNARRRNNFAYPLDALSDYHATMEEIVQPAMELTAETLTDEQLQRFRESCAVADQKWRLAEATTFDAALFGLEGARLEQIQERIAAERAAIAALQQALEGGDKQQILQAARALKPPFAQAYMAFGEFPGPANVPEKGDPVESGDGKR